MLEHRLFRVSVAMLFAGIFLITSAVMALSSSQVQISSSGTIGYGYQLPPDLPDADYYVIESGAIYYVVNRNSLLLQSGTDAATTINAAFQMMSSGQKIVIRGNILLTSTLSPIAGIYVDFGSSTIRAQTSMQYMINFAYKNGITIDGGTFYGYGTTQGFRGYTSNSIVVKNAIYENFRGTVITCDNGNGHTVQNNTIRNGHGNWAIVMNEAGNSLITQNNIDSNGDGSCIGIFSYSNGAVGNNEISYNTLTGWSQVTWHAVYIAGVPNTKVHDNIVTNPNVTGCGVAFLIKSRNTLIYNNRITNVVGGWAMHLYQEDTPAANNPSGTIITNNTISTSNVGGLYFGTGLNSVSNINVTGNSFSNLPTAIMLEPITYTLQNYTIKYNTFSNSSYAIRVGWFNPDPYNADNLLITSNTFTGISSSVVIMSAATTDTTISYNTFSGGIALQGGGTNTMVYSNTGLADSNVPTNPLPLQPNEPPL